MSEWITDRIWEVREGLDAGRSDAKLLDGKHYKVRPWRRRERALDDLGQQFLRLAEAAERLSFEVAYFDDHSPEECAIKRAALRVDDLLEEIGMRGARAWSEVQVVDR